MEDEESPDDSQDVVFDARTKMTSLSSAFAQLVHKSSLVFETNARLEKQLATMREELVHARSEAALLNQRLEEQQSQSEHQNRCRRDEEQDSLFRRRSTTTAIGSFMSPEKKVRSIKCQACHPASLAIDNNQRNKRGSGCCHASHHAPNSSAQLELPTQLVEEVNALRRENKMLRNECLSLQSNLFGAQLACKYLDKELAGRIQQIQLLAKSELRGEQHDRLWNQLEAEIHLHRHKTVVKACRGRVAPLVTQLPTANRTVRVVNIEKADHEGLGISITGGKEHGIPIIVSEVSDGLLVMCLEDFLIESLWLIRCTPSLRLPGQPPCTSETRSSQSTAST